MKTLFTCRMYRNKSGVNYINNLEKLPNNKGMTLAEVVVKTLRITTSEQNARERDGEN